MDNILGQVPVLESLAKNLEMDDIGQLNEKITENSKKPLPKATIHLVELSNDGDKIPTIEELEEKYPGISQDLKRGDIINNINGDQYRSSGSYMVGDKNIISRNEEIDDYGSPSAEFDGISHFPMNYWTLPLPINAKYIGGDESVNEFYWHMDFDLPVAIYPKKCNLNLNDIKGEYHIWEFNGNKYLLLLSSSIKTDQEIIYGFTPDLKDEGCTETLVEDYEIDLTIIKEFEIKPENIIVTW